MLSVETLLKHCGELSCNLVLGLDAQELDIYGKKVRCLVTDVQIDERFLDDRIVLIGVAERPGGVRDNVIYEANNGCWGLRRR